jgi:hypothetical protein
MSESSFFTDILQGELKQALQSRSELYLASGTYLGKSGAFHFYRFEIPENVFLKGVERATFTFGIKEVSSIEGRIVEVHCQFLIAAFPFFFGELVPSIKCTWNYDNQVSFVESLGASAEKADSMAWLLFRPEPEKNVLPTGFEPIIPPQTPPEQSSALHKILNNRVTILWGPTLCGKTYTACIAALNLLKSGKKILYVASNHHKLHQAAQRMIEIGKTIGFDVDSLKAIVSGFVPSHNTQTSNDLSFEEECEKLKSEKRKLFQERAHLIEKYWTHKVKQFLYEDYFLKIQELRDQVNERKLKINEMEKEVTALTTKLRELGDASIMERLKKGFSKQELAETETVISERKEMLKRLSAVNESIKKEILLLETNSPIKFEETKSFRETLQRIDELGGLQSVAQSIEDFIGFDENAHLKSKRLFAATAESVFSRWQLQQKEYDFVIIDDAETQNIPSIASLVMLSRGRILLCGDPFRLGPLPPTTSEASQTHLQRDIFSAIAQTTELHSLFDWAEKNPNWCIFLSSHFTTTPKLSLFTSAVIYDDKLNVFASPQAKGRLYSIDTSSLQSRCLQFAGRRKILPFNELQTRRTVELVKHILMEPGKNANDIAVIIPFEGTTIYMKQQLRLAGIERVGVGTPQEISGSRKKVVVFDTTMAGVDYTMRQIDDKKIGEERIVRIFNAIFSCVEEDLYVVADISHFSTLYKDRLFTKMLMLLQSQAEPLPNIIDSVKKFDTLDQDRLDALNSDRKAGIVPIIEKAKEQLPPQDAETALRIKMMERQAGERPQVSTFQPEKETNIAVRKVFALRKDINLLLGYFGREPMFITTMLTESASMRMLKSVCSNEKDFKELMEQWNLIIYETAARSKTAASYLSAQTPETKAWTDLKAIFPSDISTKMEEGRQKIAIAVSKIFQEMVGKSQPAGPVEWHKVYVGIVFKLETYLRWMLDQVRK